MKTFRLFPFFFSSTNYVPINIFIHFSWGNMCKISFRNVSRSGSVDSLVCFPSFLLDIAKSLPGVVAPVYTPVCHDYECFPTPSPVLGQTSDFCQSNGCKVASKYLAFPPVRVEGLFIRLLASLLFSSLICLLYFWPISPWVYLFLKSLVSSFYILDTKNLCYIQNFLMVCGLSFYFIYELYCRTQVLNFHLFRFINLLWIVLFVACLGNCFPTQGHKDISSNTFF